MRALRECGGKGVGEGLDGFGGGYRMERKGGVIVGGGIEKGGGT